MIVLSGLDDETLWDMIKSYKVNYLIENIDTINTIKPCFGLHDSTLVRPVLHKVDATLIYSQDLMPGMYLRTSRYSECWRK